MRRNAIYSKIAAAVLGAMILGMSAGWAQNIGGSQDRYFRVEWEAGQRVVTGYVYNDFNLWADNVRLLVEVVDSAGSVIAKTDGYVDGWVQPKGKAYFWVPVPAGGAAYRVSVQSFAWRGVGR